MGRKVPIELYGPDTLEPMMKQHFSFFGSLPFDITYHIPDQGGKGYLYEDDRITVTPIPLKHRITTYGYLFREKLKALNVRKECIEKYGLGIADVVRIKLGEDHVSRTGEVIPNHQLTLPPFRPRSYAYISDTIFDPSLADKLKDVDLLFHEATFAHKDKKLARATLHSTSIQAARVAKAAGAGRLLIGHFSSRYKDHELLVEEARTVFSETDGVNDGDLYSVPQRRVTTE